MGKCEVCDQPAGFLCTCHPECYERWTTAVATGAQSLSPSASRRDPNARSSFAHAAGVLTSCLLIILLLHVVGFVLPVLAGLATVFFFLRWWVFPYDAVYPAASAGTTGAPDSQALGHGVSLLQWLVIVLLFAALARRAPRVSVVGYALGTILLVSIATHLLLPLFGLRFQLMGP